MDLNYENLNNLINISIYRNTYMTIMIQLVGSWALDESN